MAWRGGLPRNQALLTRADEALAKIGDDLIHEALGSPMRGEGRSKAGLGERNLGNVAAEFQKRTDTIDDGEWQHPRATFSTTDMTLSEIVGVVAAAGLSEREIHVVVRRNEGDLPEDVAHDLGVAPEAVESAYERGMIAIERSASLSPLFGLREVYQEDLGRLRHRRDTVNVSSDRRTK